MWQATCQNLRSCDDDIHVLVNNFLWAGSELRIVVIVIFLEDSDYYTVMKLTLILNNDWHEGHSHCV